MDLVLRVINGRAFGATFALIGDRVTVGSNHACAFQVVAEGVSKRHFALERTADGWLLTSDRSSSGTYVNGARVEQHLLVVSDKIQIGASTVLLVRDARDEGELNAERAAPMPTLDGLTGVLAKSAFADAVKLAHLQCLAEHRPLCLALVDIDQLKRVVDVHGMVAGDRALRRVAQVMQQALLSNHAIGRYGGDDFGAVLQDVTLESALALCERIRSGVEQQRIESTEPGESFVVTVSIGVAALAPEMSHAKALVKRTDELLHNAKRRGRNRVVSDDGISA